MIEFSNDHDTGAWQENVCKIGPISKERSNEVLTYSIKNNFLVTKCHHEFE